MAGPYVLEERQLKKKKATLALKEKLTQATLGNKKKNVEHAFLKKFQMAAEKTK